MASLLPFRKENLSPFPPFLVQSKLRNQGHGSVLVIRENGLNFGHLVAILKGENKRSSKSE